MSQLLDIVIVNWNSGRQLRDCLESIAVNEHHGLELSRVVVVDNASEDESLDDITEIAGLPLTLIANDRNLGFAAACNQGATVGSADYVLFLNPDTSLYKDSLTTPVAFMEEKENSDVAITGIQLIDESGRVTRSCSRFPSPGLFLMHIIGLDRLKPNAFHGILMNEWNHAANRDVDQVMGAFFMVRRTVFDQLHGFDQRFFVYYEDVDFSLRARDAGWRSVYIADAGAYHRGTGTTEQIKARRLFYSLRSRLLYVYKHFTRPAALSIAFLTLMIEPLTRIIHSLIDRSPRSAKETLTAYLLLFLGLPELFSADSGDSTR
jgi:GT2 family glycosyltransferase